MQELCYYEILKNTTSFYGIDRLPLPNKLKKNLKYYFKVHKHEIISKLMSNSNTNNQQILNSSGSNNNNNNSNTNCGRISDIYVNSIINLYNNNQVYCTNNNNNNNNNTNNSSNNTNSPNISDCNNLRLNYKHTSKHKHSIMSSNHNSRPSLLSHSSNNCRKTCSLM